MISISPLDWPREVARAPLSDDTLWYQPQSNICLDFHGDPVEAELVVFSDGNHHMALAECLEIFLARVGLSNVFYATTPPGALLGCLRGASLYLGNLTISRAPHVFIGPEQLLHGLSEEAAVHAPKTLVRSRGNVLLVRAGNPKAIRDVEDLLRDDVTLFISNPDTETASYRVYADSLRALAAAQSLEAAAIDSMLSPGAQHTVFGERIHHREAPQALATGLADVAVVYYHLALRYVRIFPELFDFVPLGGTRDDPRPLPGVVITSYAVARVGDGGKWGRAASVRRLARSPR